MYGALTMCDQPHDGEPTEGRPGSPPGHPLRLAQAILNGVLGDHLALRGNPLAIDMEILLDTEGLPPGEGPTSPPPPPTNRLVVFLHGLTNLETIWNFPDGSPHYGQRLRQRFGFTPCYLRYNTGLSLEANGSLFSEILEEFLESYPGPVEELRLIGFSMGGLVIRTAQRAAERSGARWIDRVTDCVYLGTPHRGSPLERLGSRASQLLRSLPAAALSQWADWADVRSRGIQDLGHGLEGDPAASTGFHPEARHFFVSGSLSDEAGSLLHRILGDSLVREPSATPEGAPEGSLFAHFPGISHFPLAYSEIVYRQLEQWLAPGTDASPLATYQWPELPSAPEVSHRALTGGAVSLAAEGFQQTVDAVETTHRALARLPHQVLQRIPGTRSVSEVVEASQEAVADLVFQALGFGGDLVALLGEHLQEEDDPEA